MDRSFAIIAALLALLAVALGAFGAHALQERLSAADLGTFDTAVRYQMYHALGLFAVAWALGRWPERRLLAWAGGSLLAGTLVFSGSLYLLLASGQRWLGAVTPVGGLLMILGWALLALALWRTA